MSRVNPIGDYYPSEEDVLNHVRKTWRWVAGFPLVGDRSVYDVAVACPACRSRRWCVSQWQFLERDPDAGREGRPFMTRFPYRCNLALKCTDCSHLWSHGIPIPPEEEGKREGVYRRAEVLEILREAGHG